MQVDALLGYASDSDMDLLYECRRHGGFTAGQLRILGERSREAASGMREARRLLERLCADPTDAGSLRIIVG